MGWALRVAMDLEGVLDGRSSFVGTTNGLATFWNDSVVPNRGKAIIPGPNVHNGNRTVLHAVRRVLDKFTMVHVVLGETLVVTSRTLGELNVQGAELFNKGVLNPELDHGCGLLDDKDWKRRELHSSNHGN
jgi:hypothetical protein